MLPATMHALRESIDDQDDMLKVDFANMLIGGASLAYGNVQEEITFAERPELNVARLFHRPMAANEAIVLLNAQRYSTLVPGTYGGSLAHGGPAPYAAATSGPARSFAPSGILALDALDLRCLPRPFQYDPKGIDRELRKCLAGLAFNGAAHGLPDATNRRVATGNWGCGVFRGDAELKLLIQWIACSVTGREMHYFPFDRQDLVARFPPLQAVILGKQITPLELLGFLRTGLGGAAASGQVWRLVHQHFGGQP